MCTSKSFFHNIFIEYLGISHMSLKRSHFPVLPGLPPTLGISSYKKEKKKEKFKMSNSCCPCTHGSMVKFPVASSLMTTESSPPTLLPEALSCGEPCHRSLFNDYPSRLLHVGVEVGRGLSQKALYAPPSQLSLCSPKP